MLMLECPLSHYWTSPLSIFQIYFWYFFELCYIQCYVHACKHSVWVETINMEKRAQVWIISFHFHFHFISTSVWCLQTIMDELPPLMIPKKPVGLASPTGFISLEPSTTPAADKPSHTHTFPSKEVAHLTRTTTKLIQVGVCCCCCCLISGVYQSNMTIYANLCKLFVFGFNLLSILCCDWTGWLVSVCLVRLSNNNGF